MTETMMEGPESVLSAFHRSKRADQRGKTDSHRTHGIRSGLDGDLRIHNYRILFAIHRGIILKPVLNDELNKIFGGRIPSGMVGTVGGPQPQVTEDTLDL